MPAGALGPLDAEAEGAWTSRAFTDVVAGRSALSEDDVADLAGRLAATERGLIVAGPSDDPDLPAALAGLARATGYPIAADPLSGVRCGPHDRALVLSHADHLVRPGPWRDEHLPELVIRFGATPTSKPLLTLLGEVMPAQIVVDGDGGWSDPAIIPTTFIHADAAAAAVAVAAELEARNAEGSPPDPGWGTAWTDADRAARPRPP